MRWDFSVVLSLGFVLYTSLVSSILLEIVEQNIKKS